MKKFLLKLIFFTGLFSGIYVFFCFVVLPLLLEKKFGPNVKKQLDYSFEMAGKRSYDLLFLGNSRMYCGINPDMFKIPAFNFSHNNDSYNQLYYKILWLDKRNKRFKYLVLGIDYFQFSIFSDTRNYIYSKKLGAEYQKDYRKKNYTFDYYKDLLRPQKVRSLLTEVGGVNGIKDNGQYIRYGNPIESQDAKRDFTRKEIQVQYFTKIIDLCKQRNIPVFVVMLPLRTQELKQYSSQQLADFKSFVNQYSGEKFHYMNFSTDSNYKWTDFIDLTHLNQRAAARFSTQLNDSIMITLNPVRKIKL